MHIQYIHTMDIKDHYICIVHILYQDINNELRAAAEGFLENDDSCMIDSMRREVKLSLIFKWYKADFGGTDEKVLLKLKVRFS